MWNFNIVEYGLCISCIILDIIFLSFKIFRCEIRFIFLYIVGIKEYIKFREWFLV